MMERRCLRRRMRGAAAVALLLTALCPLSEAQDAREAGFPAGIRLPERSNGEAAITALGRRLPEVSAFYGKTPEQLRRHLRADPSLWVNPEGELLYACEAGCAGCGHAEETQEYAIAESVGPTDPPPFDRTAAFSLHSLPGAKRVIFLDFDGHADTSGRWKDGAASLPFDTDGNPSSFSNSERDRIIQIWQRVAEDFSIYEIDVTTEEPPIESLRKSGSNDANYGVRVAIGGRSSDWFGRNVGGVAFVGSFDSNVDVPCWVFSASLGNSEKSVAEAVSHEAGHTLGLLHDGIEDGAEYYSGHGNWAPIMGLSTGRPITQWSRGEYNNANNTQDDLAVMLTRGAVYRPDDHGNSTGAATPLTSEISALAVGGVIGRSNDIDFFRVDAAGGQLAVTASPSPRGANLRIEVKLYNSAGTLLQTATAADTSAGTQPVTLTRSVGAGAHFISIDGIGNGNAATGYTDYASLGQYDLSVTGVAPSGFTWSRTAAGTYAWATASNWSGGLLPSGAAPAVRLNNNITGNQTIQLSAASTVGRLFLGDSNSTHAFTIASAGGSLVFSNSGDPAQLNKGTGGNDTISAPVSLVGQLALAQSASGNLRFSGVISGSGSLTKSGEGTVLMGAAHTYTGATNLDEGLLRLESGTGLPGGIDNAVGTGESRLVFRGGVLGLPGDFTRQLGTGAGQLDWSGGSGGFAAFGADRQVRLNNGASSISWASVIGTGNTLILGHPTATHSLNFRNGISFAGTVRAIHVEDGEAAVDAVLSGALIGANSSGFIKTGSGTLALSNAGNTYNGVTGVEQGVLLLQNATALPSGNLNISGGAVIGLGAADFTGRGIGTAANQVQWTGEGGFAAFGATRSVIFSDSSINWTATNFIGGTRALILGHESADATLNWQQRISLAGNRRVIQVNDGSAEIDVIMSGFIAGGSSTATNNSFEKTGDGTLAFTVQNSYWGETIVSSGTLMIGSGGTAGGLSQNTTDIFLDAGATLAFNRSNALTQGTNPFLRAVTGDGGIAQVGAGTTILTLANSYGGPTEIKAGTLTLGANGVLPDASDVEIGNGMLDTGSAVESAGKLTVTGTATIRLGAGAAVSFAASNGMNWSAGTLRLTGTFVPGASLRFGTNANGLTSAQIARISAAGFTNFSLTPSGYLTAETVAPPPTGFAAWIGGNFANGTIPQNRRGALDDFDNDGVSNLLEYALAGEDPTVPNPSVGEFSDGTIAFAKRPGVTGVTYAIVASEDLGAEDPWEEVSGPTYLNGTESISYTPPDGLPQIFLRLRVLSED